MCENTRETSDCPTAALGTSCRVAADVGVRPAKHVLTGENTADVACSGETRLFTHVNGEFEFLMRQQRAATLQSFPKHLASHPLSSQRQPTNLSAAVVTGLPSNVKEPRPTTVYPAGQLALIPPKSPFFATS